MMAYFDGPEWDEDNMGDEEEDMAGADMGTEEEDEEGENWA